MQLTTWVVIVSVHGLITFDIWMAMRYGTQTTISYEVARVCQDYPVLTFLSGFLCGHLFWRQFIAEQASELLKK